MKNGRKELEVKNGKKEAGSVMGGGAGSNVYKNFVFVRNLIIGFTKEKVED
jgi:hypothetical protein